MEPETGGLEDLAASQARTWNPGGQDVATISFKKGQAFLKGQAVQMQAVGCKTDGLQP